MMTFLAVEPSSNLLPLLLLLAILLVAAKLLGALSVRLGQPAVLGELLAGLLLGPSLIDVLTLPVLRSPGLSESLRAFADIGVLCLMFAAGLETELDDLRRAGRPALLGGILGVAAPILLGGAAGWAFGQAPEQALFLGIVLSATSVSISAQTLLELGRLRSREGVALLGAAVIDDILVIMILSGFVVAVDRSGSFGLVLLQLGRMFLVLAVSFGAAIYLLPYVIGWTSRLRVSEGMLAISLALMLLFAWASEHLGSVAAITGAFITGLGMRRSRHREELEEGLHRISYGFFVPLFLVNIGLGADVGALAPREAIFALIIIAVAVLSKMLGSGLGAWLGGFDRDAALRMGLGMISRGEVGLIVAGIGLAEGLISRELFAGIVLMVLATTLLTPILLRRAYAHLEV